MVDTITLEDILASFDKEDFGDFNEYEITTELRKLTPENQSEIPLEIQAEAMAFAFAEGGRNKKNHWGTYFGPMMVSNGMEAPSIKLVTPEMIKYWEKRANEAKNPILKARYAGLVWDFTEKITHERPHYSIGVLYIESLVSIAEKKFHKYKRVPAQYLDRSLSLALQLNMPKLIERTKDAIIEYDKYLSSEDKPGFWGLAFDLLAMNDSISLEQEIENKIIADLETKLAQATAQINKLHRWDAEAAAIRLADYYKKKKKKEELKRVLLAFGDALQEITNESSAMQASGIYERIHRIYRKYNLNQQADEILIKIRALGIKVNAEMGRIPFEYKLPKNELERYIGEMLEGDTETVLTKIAVQYIPKKEEAKEEMLKISKEAPTLYLLGYQLQDAKGRTIATIGSLENDLEGHIVNHISTSLKFSMIFVRNVLHGAIQQKNLKTEDIINFLYKSPIFSDDRKDIIQAGLDYYFANNHLLAIHLLIPQIEEAVRNIIEFGGGNVLKPKGSGFFLKTLDEILREEIFVNTLGEDISYYFRVLFTDQRGWNMRNNVCHGIAGMGAFNYQSADRVLHALLCLGLLRKKQ